MGLWLLHQALGHWLGLWLLHQALGHCLSGWLRRKAHLGLPRGRGFILHTRRVAVTRCRRGRREVCRLRLGDGLGRSLPHGLAPDADGRGRGLVGLYRRQ